MPTEVRSDVLLRDVEVDDEGRLCLTFVRPMHPDWRLRVELLGSAAQALHQIRDGSKR